MRREEFMRELEYLLQDIPDEEKEDAVAYYRDYLEEAGPENEEAVIRDFGSPERIAAMIRCDINGTLEEGGSFTDQGYEDERFRDPNYQIVKRMDLPEENGEDTGGRQAGTGGAYGRGDESDGGWKNGGQQKSRQQNRDWSQQQSGYGSNYGSGYGSSYGASRGSNGNSGRSSSGNGRSSNYGSGYGNGQGSGYGSGYSSGYGTGWTNTAGSSAQGNQGKPAGRKWEWWQIAGIAILICLTAPMALTAALGIGGGLLGILAALLGVLATVTIALAACVFALILMGIVFIGVGIAHMTVPLQGFMFLGAGIGILGLGILGLSLCGLYYGRFLPWLCRSVVNSISRALHRGGKKA